LIDEVGDLLEEGVEGDVLGAELEIGETPLRRGGNSRWVRSVSLAMARVDEINVVASSGGRFVSFTTKSRTSISNLLHVWTARMICVHPALEKEFSGSTDHTARRDRLRRLR
jgi:hypothetical protein